MNIKAAVLEILFESNAAKIRSDINGVNKEVEKTGKEGAESVGSLKNGIVALATSVGVAAGAWGLLKTAIATSKKVFDFTYEGASVLQAEKSFIQLAGGVNQANSMLMEMRKLSNGTVSDLALMSSTTKLLAGATEDLREGFVEGASGLLQMAAAAVQLDPKLGSVEFAYDSLVKGIKKGQPLLIDNTNAVVSVGDANKKMADKLGISTDALTENQKQLALLEETLRAGDVMIEQIGGTIESVTDPWNRFTVAIENNSNQIKANAAGNTTLQWILTGLADNADRNTERLYILDQAYQLGIITTKEYEQESRRLADTGKMNSDRFAEIELAVSNTDLTLGESAIAVSATDEAFVMFNGTLMTTESALAAQEAQTELYTIKLEELRETQDKLKGSYSALENAQNKLSAAQLEFSRGIATDVKGALDSAGLSAEDYALALGVVDETFGSTFGRENEMQLTIQKAVDEFKRTGDVEAFGESIGTLETDFGDLATKVLEAQNEIDILQSKIDNLRGKEIDIFINFIQGSGGSYPTIPDFNVPSPPRIDRGGYGGIREERDAFGTSFTVPPGYPNDSFEWRSFLTSGEHVTVTPTGGGSGREGSQSEKRVVNNYEIHTYPPQESGLNLTQWIKMQEMLSR